MVRTSLILAVLLLTRAAPAGAGWIAEFPHPSVVVQFHPSATEPFTLEDIDRALKDGAHAVELDLRWRDADRSVVCSHSPERLAERPTLEQAIERVLRFENVRPRRHGGNTQFFIVLDLKERSPALLDGVVAVLRAHGDRWSTAVGPHGNPRPITVIASGERLALSARVPPATLDSLCILEGVDYGGRIQNRTGIPFQWIALPHPSERGRVRALHTGTDLAVRGKFLVRAYGCRGRIRECLDAGVDAVNADRDEVARACSMTVVPEW